MTMSRRRIAYPEGTVRTREQILAGVTVVGAAVWVECWNCGGSGDYPSSMTPPGRCRLYCWRNRTRETYGKLAVNVDRFVKNEQARDRREYRHQLDQQTRAVEIAANQARYAEEHRQREEAERARREAEAAEKAARRHVGTIGQRITLVVTVEAKIRLENGDFGDRYLVRFRDAEQNQLVWWTGNPCVPGAGTTVTVVATVKDHDRYDGEAQTVVQRVKVTDGSQ